MAAPTGERRRRFAAAAAGALWLLTVGGIGGLLWLDHLLRRAGRADLAFLRVASVPYVVGAVSAATVGLVLATRRCKHPVGWLLLGLGVLVPLNAGGNAYAHYGVMARPGAAPGAAYLAGPSTGMVVLYLLAAGLVLLLTPTGTLPSRRWRWLVWAMGAASAGWVLAATTGTRPLQPEDPAFVNPIGAPAWAAGVLDGALEPAGAVAVVALLAAAWSLVLRFRRARGLERQQLRWLALAAGFGAVALLAAVVGGTIGTDTVVVAALGTCVALLPLATGAAILRYRLYDLDRIISRTLAYGLLTVLLGGGYAAVVLGLGQLVGQDSPLLVAAATLALAAAFQPTRRRVQAAVDRRFNRRRYDAARTIQGFAARLRQQIDLDALSAELLAVVDQTMQPTHLALWLRPSGRR